MGRISKGFSLSVAILSFKCLALGVALTVIANILADKSPTSIVVKKGLYDDESTFDVTFFLGHWWVVIAFVIPGILGIMAGCTKKVGMMILYLVMTIICMLASIVLCGIVAVITTAWIQINNDLQSDLSLCVTKESSCACFDVNRQTYIELKGVSSCKSLWGVQGVLVACLVVLSLILMVSSIASYIACCSFCNKEREYHDGVIVQPNVYGPASPASPAVVVTNNLPPQQYLAPPPYQPYYNPPNPDFFKPEPQILTYPSAPQYTGYYQQQGHTSNNDRAPLVNHQVV